MGTDYKAIAVIRSPIGHVIALWASYFVPSKIGRREEFDFGDDDCFVARGDGIRRGVFKLVRGYEEGIGGRVEDTSFVEIGSAWVVNQKLKSRIGPEEGKEGVVIDEKGFRLCCCRRYESGSCSWSVVDGVSGARRSTYCHNASLCRLMRWKFRLSPHICWEEALVDDDVLCCEAALRCGAVGEGGRELDAVEGLPLSLLLDDLEESEKETL